MFLCPRCETPLGDLRLGEVFEQVCARCRYKYQVVSGRLADRSTWPVATHQASADRAVSFDQAYELHLALVGDRIEVAAFRLHHRREPVAVKPGDSIAVVYTLRGDERDQLVQVLNYTSGTSYEIARPGASSQVRAGCLAVALGLATFLLLVGSTLPGIAMALPILVFGVSMILLTKLFEPTHRVPAHELAAREAARGLLEQKHALEGQRARVAADREEKAALRHRLAGLQRKMREVALPVYLPRIETLGRAIAQLDAQIALEDRLRDGYDRSVKILEIELEAGAATEALAGDVAASMEERLAELRALEAEHAELGRQLEANAEVERLLGGDRGGSR